MSNEEKRKVAGRILDLSKTAVTTVRGAQHGDAEASFRAIGEMWTAYLNALSIRQTGIGIIGLTIGARDVALMMDHVKQMRVMYGDESNPDNYIDAAGYVALAGMFHVPAKAVALADAGAAAGQEHRHEEIPSFLTRRDGKVYQYEIPAENGQVTRLSYNEVEAARILSAGEMIPEDHKVIQLGLDRWPKGNWTVMGRAVNEGGTTSHLILAPAPETKAK